MSAQTHDPATPTETDVMLARESLHQLAHHLGAGKSVFRIHIQADEQPGEEITLPVSAIRLLRDILVEMGKRKTVGGQEDMIEDVALDLARAAKTRGVT